MNNNNEFAIAIHEDVAARDAVEYQPEIDSLPIVQNRILREQHSSYRMICCLSGATCCFVLLMIPLIIGELSLYLIVAPIGIPFYYYKTKKYQQWLYTWNETLTANQRMAIESYIDGPINLHTFDAIAHKVNPATYIEIINGESQIQKNKTRYRHVPEHLLHSRFWPYYGVLTKEYFMSYLAYMLSSVHEDSKMISVNAKYFCGLLIEIQQSCPICLENYRDPPQDTYLTKCIHIFHKKCIDDWMSINPICPVCRHHI